MPNERIHSPEVSVHMPNERRHLSERYHIYVNKTQACIEIFVEWEIDVIEKEKPQERRKNSAINY